MNDFDIPLKLSHTVIEIHGDKRLTGVTIAKVDENRKPILETKEYIACDTLLLSVGLIPENELSKSANIKLSNITSGAVVDQNRETSVPGVFACGNVLHVHDLVDFVSEEAEIAGLSAANYIKGLEEEKTNIIIKTDGKIRYTVPTVITSIKDVKVFFRVSDVFKNVNILVKNNDNIVLKKKKAKVAPGEMETVILKKENLKDISELSFELEVL